MKYVLYTNSISPHQLPLAREIVARVGPGNYRYIYTNRKSEERLNLGWGSESEPWLYWQGENSTDFWEELESAEVLIVDGIRPLDLIEHRAKNGLKTLYQTERWFKPIPIKLLGLRLLLPGYIRMFVPCYRKMAKRFVRLFNYYGCCKCLPMGPWARKDFERMGVRPDKMIDWGYFVEPSSSSLSRPQPTISTSKRALRVLWVGRMLALKRVDTLIRAVAEVAKSGKPIICTIVGSGPEESDLKKLASALQLQLETTTKSANSIVDLDLQPRPIFTFLPPVPIAQVRELMCQHDVYVFPSNAEEGWGAVVSEALEEGMAVLGSYECGAAPALLPGTCLFHSGDWRTLAELLTHDIQKVDIGMWSAAKGAERIMAL